jgi:branched-chain amino acid transport system ATP-binding protein
MRRPRGCRATGYNDVPVVRELSLHVEPGEVVALLGSKGAGKTTTLVTTLALNPIIKGDIKVLGRSVKGRRSHLVAPEGLAHVLELPRRDVEREPDETGDY